MTTSLHKAADEGNSKLVKEILDHNQECDINGYDDQGFTPLHYAIQCNNVRKVTLLLDYGAKIDFPDKFGSSPLQTASRYNATEVVELLLRRGANPYPEDVSSAKTPLHLASPYGNTMVPESLHENSRIEENIANQKALTALQTAFTQGCGVMCSVLLQNGAKVKEPGDEGMTALHYAACNANPKMVSLLLETERQRRRHSDEPANVLSSEDNEAFLQFLNSRDSEKNTALHMAAQTGNVMVAQVLIEQGAEVNPQNNALQTPTHLATARGSYKVLNRLIQSGADVNCGDIQNRTSLHYAASFGNMDCAKTLLETGADFESRDNNSFSPLLTAVFAGQTECAKLLLDSGASKTARDVQHRCCLHLAVEREKLETLTMLLSETEDEIVNACDHVGQTPLHYAAVANDSKILEFLIDHGANCILKDSTQKTALHLAAEKGKSRQVEILIKGSLSCVWQLDQLKRTPLHYAVMNIRKKSVTVLLDMGSGINNTDINSWTPLMWACRTGSDAIVRLLLEKHADLDHADLEGNTALHVSVQYGHVEITRLLMDKGAKVLMNKNGMTCSDVAMEIQSNDVVMVIVRHPRWKEVLLAGGLGGSNSMERLIQQFPEAAEVVFDRCVQRSSSNKTVTYDFHLLDPGPDDCSSRDGQRFFALETMYDKRQQNLLKHPLCRKHLKTKWRTFGQAIYLSNLVLYLIFLCFMSAFMVMERGGVELHINATNSQQQIKSKNKAYQAIPYIISSFAIGHLLKEIYQLVTQKFRYFKDPTNLLEWSVYLTVVVFLLPSTLHVDFIQELSPRVFWITGTIAVFLGYVNLLFFLQTIEYIGLYVTMFIEVMRTMFKVLFLFVLFSLAFATVFFTLLKEEEDFATIGLSFVKVFAMTTGEFDYSDIFVSSFGKVNAETGFPLVPYENLSLFFFCIFVLAMTIVLMNLLVGLAVGDIDSIQKSASMRNKGRQIRFIVEVEKKYPKFITRLLYKPVVVSKLKKGKRKASKADFYHDEDLAEEEDVDRQDENELRYRSLSKDITKIKNRQKELATLIEQQRDVLKAMASKLGVEFN